MRHITRAGASDRTTLGLVAGAVIALGGLVLFLSAHALATTWQSLGPGVWGGTTDPATERTYQVLGFVVLAFGLILIAVAFRQWLVGDRPSLPKHVAPGPPVPGTRRCPQCGATVRPDAPEGLCPECLLKEVMQGDSEPGQGAGATGPYSPGSAAPGPDELARQFPQLEILELLGQGGMGIVYKARQPRLDRFVALKILPAAGRRDPAFAERFAREARALARVTHPGIVTVYDFGDSGGHFYLLMEFVDGVNLRHLLRERRLKPDEALRIVPQLCEALEYAHGQGIVHRDIKPENILVDRRGHVKIADFGLAKLVGPQAADSVLTGAQQVMGTPHYMAPEQLERPLAVDHRADIYSLGVVFYEMLTGELPLGRFAPPSQKVQVDVRLDEVVLRALAKEPERRYQHASDVKEEVQTIRDSPLGVASAPANQKGGESTAAASGHWKHDSRTFHRGCIRWIVLVCLLGLAGILQPFFPFAEMELLDARGVGVPIAQVFGYESLMVAGAGVNFAVVLLLCIATGPLRSVPLWRSLFVICAAIGSLATMAEAIQSTRITAADNSNRSGRYECVVLGNRLSVSYTIPEGEFKVRGATKVVQLPGGKLPSEVTRLAIRSPSYVIIALGCGLLLLGCMQVRAWLLLHGSPLTAPDDAEAISPLVRKLQSVWQSALAFCIGSRVQAPSYAPVNGATLRREEPFSQNANLPVLTSETPMVRVSPMTPVNPAGTADPAHAPTPSVVGFPLKAAKTLLLIVFACCLILFLSYGESSSGNGHVIRVGAPSPWLEAEKHATGFRYAIRLGSWSWAVAALGALASCLYSVVRKLEDAEQPSKPPIRRASGFHLWVWIVVFALAVASIRAILMIVR